VDCYEEMFEGDNTKFCGQFFSAATVPCYLLTQNILAVIATFLLTCEYASLLVPIKKKSVQRLFIGSVHLITVHPHNFAPCKFIFDDSVSFCTVARTG